MPANVNMLAITDVNFSSPNTSHISNRNKSETVCLIHHYEALAQQTAARIATALTDNKITFYVDHHVLAQAAACRSIHVRPGYWEIRHSLATFFQVTNYFQVQVSHSNMNLNNEAHNSVSTADLALTSLHPDDFWQ